MRPAAILRSLFPLLFLSAVVLTYSCTDDGRMDNTVTLRDSTVPASSTGQFVSIVSSVDWTITLEFPDGQEPWCIVSPGSGSGSRNNIMLTYAANTDSTSRSTVILVSFSDGEAVSLRLVQLGAGDEDPDTGDGEEELTSDPVYAWMELPEVETPEMTAYVFHHAELNGEQRRNWSMLYDARQRIALWVAYPLCSDYTGSGGRTDAWGYDPKIPAEYQPVLFRGWSGRGYDRGHQIPSGSRNADRALNAQTFYFTNMTAQVSGFNQNLWANVETRVRSYASTCDTLYVVTGPLFYSDAGEESRYAYDNNGDPSAVPDGYFKVLLRYTLPDTYYSVAFIYDNTDYDRSVPGREDLHTVAEVEEMTGFTFFNNLPPETAAAVKSQLEPQRWGL